MWEFKFTGLCVGLLCCVYLQVVESQRSDDDFAVSIATLEIYNDQLRDLNALPGAPAVTIGSRSRARSKSSDSHEDGTDSKSGSIDDGRGTSVHGLNWVSVKDYDEAVQVMEKGRANRATATTNIHAHSSRSHEVVIINLRARQGGSSFSSASLFLIDLAGSERVNKSKVTGDQLKEVG